MDELERAVETGDADEVLRLAEQLIDRREWKAVLNLARACRRATDRGKQLWAVAEHAYYRAALQAPAAEAAAALVESPGRFGLGPLSEVIAQHHTWAELAPHLPAGPLAAGVVVERLLRGEHIPDTELTGFVEVPYPRQPWEATIELPTYRAYEVEAPRPAEPVRAEISLPPARTFVDDDPVRIDLANTVAHWAAQSTGVVRTAAVHGPAEEAIAALGPRRARAAEIRADLAIALVAWASASGAGQGRRRGLATARFDCWWLLARLLDLDWPADPAEIGRELPALRWLVWDSYEPELGWRLQLAIGDTDHGVSWSISALDC